MGLDIRLPIGLMFAIMGIILAVYGLITSGDSALYARSLSININIWWGVAMFAFGLLMLFLGRHGIASVSQASDSPEGRATEEREHEEGLEN